MIGWLEKRKDFLNNDYERMLIPTRRSRFVPTRKTIGRCVLHARASSSHCAQ